MFTKLHWLIYKFLKNSLKFLLLWASITFSHQECHNYACQTPQGLDLYLVVGKKEMKSIDVEYQVQVGY
jgi:hypothetical protein